MDTDVEGNKAAQKIRELYLNDIAAGQETKFKILLLGKAAGVSKTDVAIEDLFPDEFYLNCTNKAYGVSMELSDLPADGSTLITKRVESVLVARHGKKSLDKGLVMQRVLDEFDQWNSIDDLPAGTADHAEKLFEAINSAFM